MYHALKIIRAGIYLSCYALLLNGCAQVQEKTAPKVHTIEIRQMQFMPDKLSVLKGDTVLWINRDIVTHDVTEESKKSWTSSPLSPGKSWSMVATQSCNYYCSIHVVMKGKLLVQ